MDEEKETKEEKNNIDSSDFYVDSDKIDRALEEWNIEENGVW